MYLKNVYSQQVIKVRFALAKAGSSMQVSMAWPMVWVGWVLETSSFRMEAAINQYGMGKISHALFPYSGSTRCGKGTGPEGTMLSQWDFGDVQ